MYLKTTLVLFALLSLGIGSNLVVNGDFEQDLSVGWTTRSDGIGGHYTERLVDPDPDPDYEARVEQYSGSGWTRLSQLIDVAGPDLDFSFNAKWRMGGSSPTCWPVGSVILEYYDAGDALLGDTRWYYHDGYCDWQPSGSSNLIDIASPDWMQYSLNIQQEIDDNLPDVSAADVRKVGVAFFCYTSGG